MAQQLEKMSMSPLKELAEFSLLLENMSGICTYGAPALAGKNIGLIGLLLSSHYWHVPLVVYHHVIHQKNFAAQTLRMDHVMGLVVSTVNFIRSRVLIHRQFKIMLEEIECEYKDGKKQDISQLWRYITAFRTKLKLWVQQLREENYAHFKTLSERQQNGQCVEVNSEQYVNIVSDLSAEFAKQFFQFAETETKIKIFSDPFSVKPSSVAVELQIKLSR
ncbi:general transcription factor II-I repeat domain-containing protein 2-like [Watersipora subatra]|uniref:general transcription factor II-I repeat domain-containing protein 2-like n=1 Tax=Watersipora subatra TaxID=2589382 RepID=UPI00355C83FC